MTDNGKTRFQQALQHANEDTLGAFISVVGDDQLAARAVDAERATALAGMPFAVKDNIDTVALPTTANTPALAGSLRDSDNPVVARLVEAGALIVGKTNLHELAFGITTGAAAQAATRNPFDDERSPGGSSGGSGAAVGAGIVPFALATDTGGSISIPAAWCGVYGYRPSIGRWPQGGTAPLSKSRDSIGVIAQTLELALLVDEAVREGDVVAAAHSVCNAAAIPHSVALRIGVPRDDSRFLDPLTPDVREAWQTALRQLERAEGLELVAVDTDLLHELDEQCSIPIVLYETARDLSAYLAALPTPVPLETVIAEAGAADVKVLLQLAYDARDAHEQYASLMTIRGQLIEAWRQLFVSNRLVALLHPTTPISPVPVGDDVTTQAFGVQAPTFGTSIRNTGPGSNAALPAVTLPLGIGSGGLPVGITLQGWLEGDDALLAAAGVLDRVIGVRSPLLES